MFYHRSLSLCAIVVSLLCSIAAWSQEPPKQDAQKPQPKQNLVKFLRSDTTKSTKQQWLQTFLRSQWEGASDLAILGCLRHDDVRKGLNISDEQYTKIQEVQGRIGELLQKYPDFVSLQTEMQKLRKLDDPMMLNADAETKKKLSELQRAGNQLAQNIMSEEINKIITPEQRTKYQEFQLATMSENPLVSAKMFNVLGLSEEQKQKMSAVQKELEPSFNQFSNDFVNTVLAFQDKLFERLEQGNFVIENPTELQKKITEMEKEFEKDEEFLKLQKKIAESGQSFTTQVKFRMFDVLTEEQIAKLQDLIDNPPDYVKQYIADAKKKREAMNPADPQSFLKSWKPGDGVPEWRLKKMQEQESKTRKQFPKSE